MPETSSCWNSWITFVDPPRYTIEECMQRGLTYSVPLKAKLRLSCNDEEHVDFQTIVQDVFLGNIPYMTPKGTFVINGAERVIVSQLAPLSRGILWTKFPPERY
jgi:DNA-directed RNA polymerase subunit beta